MSTSEFLGVLTFIWLFILTLAVIGLYIRNQVDDELKRKGK